MPARAGINPSQSDDEEASVGSTEADEPFCLARAVRQEIDWAASVLPEVLPTVYERHAQQKQWRESKTCPGPVYIVLYLTMLVAILGLVPGHLFHSCFCQGGPVREDETALEKEARMIWVYGFSGGFVLAIIIDVGLLLATMPEGKEMFGTVCALIVMAMYLGSNVSLLYHMRYKDATFVRLSAFAKISYGLAFVMVTVIEVLKEGTTEPPSFARAAGLCIRTCFSLSMALAVVGYCPLLGHEYEQEPEASCCRYVKLALMTFSTISPCIIVALADVWGGEAFWVGMAGF